MAENKENDVAVAEDPKLVTFNKMKLQIDNQVDTLKKIKVTDSTSLAVANQQLSAGKKLLKGVDTAHAAVKEEALRFCQAADKAKKSMRTPLEEAMGLTEKEVLAYNTKVEKENAAALFELNKKQQEETATSEKEAAALVIEMKEFEKRAFNLINLATATSQLADVYENYITKFPAKYDKVIMERVKALGTAKFNVIKSMDTTLKLSAEDVGRTLEAYETLYNTVTNTVPEVKAVATSTLSFDAIEKEKVVLQSNVPTNIKKDWVHELVDLSAVPLEWLMLNEKAVKEYIKANSDKFTEDQIITGVKFKTEASVKVK